MPPQGSGDEGDAGKMAPTQTSHSVIWPDAFVANSTFHPTGVAALMVGTPMVETPSDIVSERRVPEGGYPNE